MYNIVSVFFFFLCHTFHLQINCVLLRQLFYSPALTFIVGSHNNKSGVI